MKKVFRGGIREFRTDEGEFVSNPGPLAPKARIIPLDQFPADGAPAQTEV